ncbi:unnamed protein product [Menidia menidia]|uniref:(Atlantic silverside) hypothetical protein n=1 Tax=Menidia menidia TaxID=238744 RepID=A0A8S4BGC4_9TELE|nr:unnamed protein product [Menidia menidia]
MNQSDWFIHLLFFFCPSDEKTVTFSRVSNGASFGADQQLLDQLNKSPHFHLKEADLDECQIIFVFCTINTRIESDVKAAMEQIPESAGDKPVILVVMHHKRDIDFTTTRKNWKEKYEHVQLDVEVLFHRTEGGLLRCEKNDQAVREIRKKVEEKWSKGGEKRGTERGEKEERKKEGRGRRRKGGERGGRREIKEEGGGTEERKQEGGVKEKGGHESSRKKPRTETAL